MVQSRIKALEKMEIIKPEAEEKRSTSVFPHLLLPAIKSSNWKGYINLMENLRF